MPFVLKQFPIGPMQNFGYLIGDDASRTALVVDPAWSVPEIKKVAAEMGYTVAALAVTHAHFDHTNAIEALLETLDVPVYAHKDEIAYARSGTNIVGDLGRTVRPVDGSEKIRLGQTEIECLHTPGHTPGSMCLRVGDSLITGDTLFVGGCGRSDLPGGNPSLLFQTLRKLAGLPGALEICPGHDYGQVPKRRLSDEIAVNPYLRMKDEDAFIDAVG
jgi:glyoxylase-like metal-dependent hydrolase (beta-lactamase superfamily II)